MPLFSLKTLINTILLLIPPVFVFSLDVSAHASVQCSRKNTSEIHCTFTLPEYHLYEKQWVSQWPMSREPGAPQLPQTGFLLQVSEHDEIHIDISESHHHHYHLESVEPAPVAHSYTKWIYQKNEQIYQSNLYYPGSIFEISPIIYWRQTPIKRIIIRPFHWNPILKDLKIFQDIDFIITIPEKRPLNSSTICQDKTDPIKSKLIVNYSSQYNVKHKFVRTKTSTMSSQKLNLSILENGIYALTFEDFQSHHFPITDHPIEYLQLWLQDVQIPLEINTQSSYFQEGDLIRFYGQKIDSHYTDKNVYQLSWAIEKGLRIPVVNASPHTLTTKVMYGFHKKRYEINNPKAVWTLTPGAPETDFIFWSKLTAPDCFSTTFDLPNFTSSTVPVKITITTQAKTDSAHHLSIHINDHFIAQNDWNCSTRFDISINVDSSILKSENNVLSINTWLNDSEQVDIIYVDQFSILYPGQLIAQNDRMSIGFNNFQSNIELTGFTNKNIDIYDISIPCSPIKLANHNIFLSNYEYFARFYNNGSNQIYASSEKGWFSPNIRLIQTDRLKSRNFGADYVIITPEKYFSAVKPLMDHYTNKGLRVITVSPEEIFDTFNGGIVNPQAIHIFLKYAYHQWIPPSPKYVLMAGDSNLDYLNYFETNKQNDAPLYLSFFEDIGISPDDNHYVCSDGDDSIPDMIIGRISGKDICDISTIVNKSLSYLSTYHVTRQFNLFISDNDDSNVFANINQSAMQYFQEQMEQDHLKLAKNSDIDEFKRKLISFLNQGALITSYVGHGSIDNWAGEFIFETADIQSIQKNTPMSLYLSLNCLSGFFGLPDRYCLAESLIMARNKAAIGVFAPTALTETWEVDLLIREIFSMIKSYPKLSMGELVTAAKISVFGKGQDRVKLFSYMGDPAMPLNIHSRGLPGDADNDELLSLADILLMLKVLNSEHNEIDFFPLDININYRVDLLDVLHFLRVLADP